ncbi:hypothetical protein NEOLEDRAFT_1145040 [Neolentinus lepideus HHB14362 ss-1]|uniref:Uncharacterized protein n=1 Tax=Neolentinus lepideus HHB14362 ss-1 TaxID=1314782 RepID=A0A165V701_9AGAM|nr:hypothetical protein NEOLEDRAFT_1145040 [Neolentinus lepideus HHB14362 ss-1]
MPSPRQSATRHTRTLSLSSGHRLEPIPETADAEFQWTYTQTSHHAKKYAHAGPSTYISTRAVDTRPRQIPQIVVTRAQPPSYRHYPSAPHSYRIQNPAFLTTPDGRGKSSDLKKHEDHWTSTSLKGLKITDDTSTTKPLSQGPAAKFSGSSSCRQAQRYAVEVSIVPVDDDNDEDTKSDGPTQPRSAPMDIGPEWDFGARFSCLGSQFEKSKPISMPVFRRQSTDKQLNSRWFLERMWKPIIWTEIHCALRPPRPFGCRQVGKTEQHRRNNRNGYKPEMGNQEIRDQIYVVNPGERDQCEWTAVFVLIVKFGWACEKRYNESRKRGDNHVRIGDLVDASGLTSSGRRSKRQDQISLRLLPRRVGFRETFCIVWSRTKNNRELLIAGLEEISGGNESGEERGMAGNSQMDDSSGVIQTVRRDVQRSKVGRVTPGQGVRVASFTVILETVPDHHPDWRAPSVPDDEVHLLESGHGQHKRACLPSRAVGTKKGRRRHPEDGSNAVNSRDHTDLTRASSVWVQTSWGMLSDAIQGERKIYQDCCTGWGPRQAAGDSAGSCRKIETVRLEEERLMMRVFGRENGREITGKGREMDAIGLIRR